MAKRKCKVGFSCKKTCIEQTKDCLEDFDKEASAILDKLSVSRPQPADKKVDANKPLKAATLIERGKMMVQQYVGPSYNKDVRIAKAEAERAEDNLQLFHSKMQEIKSLSTLDWREGAKRRGYDPQPDENKADFLKRLGRESKKLSNQLVDTDMVYTQKRNAPFEALRKDLVERLPKEKPDLEKLGLKTKADEVYQSARDVDGSRIKLLGGKKKEQTEEQLSDVVNMMGGSYKGKSLSFVEGSPNGWVNSNIVNVGSSDNIHHLMGHAYEKSNPELNAAAREFINSKITSKGPEPLNTIGKTNQYKSSETAYRGKFAHPYVGKVYQDGTTEVLSMGLEFFTSAPAMANLYERDPEHFNFVLGVILNSNNNR